MSGKGNPFYMSTFKNYLNFVKIIASYYENKVITNVICIVTLYEYNIVYCHQTSSPTPHKKEIPPGHAKKIHGHKSAKFDAPGHHKH